MCVCACVRACARVCSCVVLALARARSLNWMRARTRRARAPLGQLRTRTRTRHCREPRCVVTVTSAVPVWARRRRRRRRRRCRRRSRHRRRRRRCRRHSLNWIITAAEVFGIATLSHSAACSASSSPYVAALRSCSRPRQHNVSKAVALRRCGSDVTPSAHACAGRCPRTACLAPSRSRARCLIPFLPANLMSEQKPFARTKVPFLVLGVC